MTRALAVACLCLMASGCLHGARRGASPADLPRPWLALEEACSVDASGSQVCCNRDPFVEAARGAVTLWEQATVCRARLTECRSHAATDSDVCLTQRAELQARLDDPWRSPWLWGILGLVAGGALAAGLMLAAP